ncbi:uncharacterized protein LOC126847204 isoform X1 [Adelges cooleyi]|uniref:uncharacterized protein LOC126847204 isoform X1 n=1 Tax=Adelges cooleyi TaxID=133065 RepID=UPI002180851F|nr:uncharacterized protein LOC126847204 isoform X1 [Adelges cooleyi]
MPPKYLMFVILVCLVINVVLMDAAPTAAQDDNEPVSLPRSVAELVEWEEFRRMWRDAAKVQLEKRFPGSGPAPSRNMIGDVMTSEDFQKGMCAMSGMGMKGMSSMMTGRGAPWDQMSTFVGSENTQHSACDLMMQTMTQSGTGINGYMGRLDNDASRDPAQVIDMYFQSRAYDTFKDNFANMFSNTKIF